MDIIIGKTEAGEDVVWDVYHDPHMVVTGRTGSGKTNFLCHFIEAIAEKYSPEEVRCILVDTKRCAFSEYMGWPHILGVVHQTTAEALIALEWMVGELERRFEVLNEVQIMNIWLYNNQAEATERMYHVIYIVDELSDLMRSKEGADFEVMFIRLAQLGRAAGLHFVVSSSCPTADVFPGLLLANVFCRVAFPLPRKIEQTNFMWNKRLAMLPDEPGVAYIERYATDFDVVKVKVPLCKDAV